MDYSPPLKRLREVLNLLKHIAARGVGVRKARRRPAVETLVIIDFLVIIA
jgi:hypothetical protein